MTKKYKRKLDDQATIYSLSRNKKDPSIFRLSVTLKEDINRDILQKAVEISLQKYQAYKVKMKAGLFWYYLEENTQSPIVTKEKDNPFKNLNTPKNNNYLFKVTYQNNRIDIEFFHTLTDGTGGSEFFKEIIYNYIELFYLKGKSKVISTEIIADSENAYTNNYLKNPIKVKNPLKAFTISGKELKQGLVAITHVKIPVSEIKAVSKEKQCSLSIFLVSLLVYSIYKEKYQKYNSTKPINVCIPVDLRKYFSTETVSNFVSYIVASIKLEKNDSFEDILIKVKQEFENKLQEEQIVSTMTSNGKAMNNILIKMLPLVIKRPAILLGTLGFKTIFSTTFSNIGVLNIKDEYKEYIEDYYFTLAPDWAEKIRCGVVSFNDKMVVTFGTNLITSDIEKRFTSLLDELQISYKIETNGINKINKTE